MYKDCSIKKNKVYVPYFPTDSSKVKNVRETIKLNTQLVAVASDVPVLRAQSG